MQKMYKPIILILLSLALLTGGISVYMLNNINSIAQKANLLMQSENQDNIVNQGDDNLTDKYSVGMFSWEDEPYVLESRTDFYATLESLGVTEVYQSFSDPKLYSDEVHSLIQELGNMNIDLYYLTGKAEWAISENAKEMIYEINKVVSANKAMKDYGQFSGIMFDVEPYLTDEWDNDEDQVLDIFIKNMKTTYDYAKSKNLKIILCVPGWYDKKSEEMLEEIILNCSDEISVMNYNRQDEIGSISKEVELAKKYDKALTCIFEFQAVGNHELTENETYANAGLGAAKESFEVLYNNLGYGKLKFAYHYYKPIKEMLA